MNTSNPFLEIRSAVNDDIPAIQEIAHETWPVTYNRIIPSRQVEYMLDQRYSTDILEEEMHGHLLRHILELKAALSGEACRTPQQQINRALQLLSFR